MPPSRAIAIAIRASVTVSIAALSSGMFSLIRFETWVAVFAWDGMTSLALGCSSTSSKVRPSVANGAGTPAGVRSEDITGSTPSRRESSVYAPRATRPARSNSASASLSCG